jgi:hypothetical protein
MGMTDGDRFCDVCGIGLGLHDTDDPDTDGFDCAIADYRAGILRMFEKATSAHRGGS